MSSAIYGRLFDRFLLGGEPLESQFFAGLSWGGGERSGHSSEEVKTTSIDPALSAAVLRIAEIPTMPRFGTQALWAETLRRSGQV